MLNQPPREVCILRLSALGDTCHVVPVLRALQRAWPATRFSWVIGKLESRLMGLLPEVELITVDKRAGLAGLTDLRARLAGRRFDVLLHMQLALRASACAMAIPARVKLGFDRARARELQWLFTNRRIAARSREHVLDSFFGFAEALGVHEPHVPRSPADWALPLPEEAQRYARDLIPDGRATLLISPASSHALRNWDASRYARVADHAARELGLAVILCGGPSAIEKTLGAQIVAACRAPPLNQIGRDTLPQMQALLGARACSSRPTPGPAHMATSRGHGRASASTRPRIPPAAAPTCRASGASIATTRPRAASAAGRRRSCPGPRRSSGRASWISSALKRCRRACTRWAPTGLLASRQ